jgi:hypothetical protein
MDAFATLGIPKEWSLEAGPDWIIHVTPKEEAAGKLEDTVALMFAQGREIVGVKYDALVPPDLEEKVPPFYDARYDGEVWASCGGSFESGTLTEAITWLKRYLVHDMQGVLTVQYTHEEREALQMRALQVKTGPRQRLSPLAV